MAMLIASSIDFDRAVRAVDHQEGKVLLKAYDSDSVIDQIGAAVSARAILGVRMDRPELLRYIQHLQSRYRSVVGKISYSRYEKDLPADLISNIESMKAEIMTLSYRLRLAYTTTYIRDKEVSSIRNGCAVAMILSFLCISALMWLKVMAAHNRFDLLFSTTDMAIVGLIGFGGALTSIARRAHQILSTGLLADDPVIQTSAIGQGKSSLIIAGLTGPIFSVVLLLVFVFSGVNVPGITPQFSPVSPDAQIQHPDFLLFDRKVWLCSGLDAAKLAVWSFISGFAEQFVPDVLDRFSKEATENK